MTQPLDQSQLVPGRHDKLAAAALQRMIQAHQNGLQVEAAQAATEIDLSGLDPQQIAEYDQVVGRIKQVDAQARAIIERAENHRPRNGTARSRVAAVRAARGYTGIPRSWKIIGGGIIGVLLLLLLGAFLLGRATGGGGSAAAPLEAVSTAAVIAPTAVGSGAQIANTGTVSETGSVLLTGDMRLKIKANGAEAEITPATMQDGPYNMGGIVIGTISSDAASGGKRLSFNGTTAVTVSLFKVDPALAPVLFTLGERSFTVLAQTDSKFHLITLGDGGKDWGTYAPPETIDIGSTVITTADAGDSIEITFPAMPTPPATEPTAAPAGQG